MPAVSCSLVYARRYERETSSEEQDTTARPSGA
jgi:hypothetical protein